MSAEQDAVALAIDPMRAESSPANPGVAGASGQPPFCCPLYAINVQCCTLSPRHGNGVPVQIDRWQGDNFRATCSAQAGTLVSGKAITLAPECSVTK